MEEATTSIIISIIKMTSNNIMMKNTIIRVMLNRENQKTITIMKMTITEMKVPMVKRKKKRPQLPKRMKQISSLEKKGKRL
jgi:hypothetical protein